MSLASGPYCGALGCGEGADVIINVDGRGKRYACDEHADDGEVVDDV